MSRGAVLALGFIVGRILHRQNHNITSPSTSAVADEEIAAVERMDVDMNTVTSSDSALNTAISSAVHRLGECSLYRTVHCVQCKVQKGGEKQRNKNAMSAIIYTAAFATQHC